MKDSAPGRRKVLFVSHAANFYGACRSLYDILSGLDRNLYEPHLASPETGILVDRAKALAIPTVIVPYKSWASFQKLASQAWINLRAGRALARYVRENKIDLVYTNSGVVIAGALAAKFTGKPHIWHVREDVSHHAWAFKTIHRLSKIVIANSEFTKRRFPASALDDVAVVYNGFRLPDYETAPGDKDAARKKYGLAPSAIVVSLVGNINDRKGQKESLLALPAVLEKFPDVRMVFAGECYPSNQSYQDELDKIGREKHLEKYVVYTGFQEKISEIYKMSDLLIIPSNYEAFGRVVVEAMLFGVPVLGMNVCGIPEIITSGKTGLLMDSREPAAFAREMISALSDRPSLSALAEAGRQSARERFRVEATVAGVTRHIAAAL